MFVRPLNRVRSVFRFFCYFSGVFFSKNNALFCQLVLEPCGRMAEKNWVGPKTAVFRPFPRGKKVSEKKRKKKSRISRPRCHYHSMPSRHKPSLKLPYRILPPSPTCIVLWYLWARIGVVITSSHNNSRKHSHKNPHKYSQNVSKWLYFDLNLVLFFYVGSFVCVLSF